MITNRGNIALPNLVRDWSKLPIELPAEVKNCLDLLKATNQSKPAPLPEVTDISDADKLVKQFTKHFAEAKAQAEAKSHLNQVATKRLQRAMQDAVPQLIEDLQEPFNASAARYTEAVKRLPKELTAEALVNAPGNVSEAYRTAEEEYRFLRQVEVAYTGILQHLFVGTQPGHPMKLCGATTQAELAELRKQSGSQIVRKIGEVLFNAVHAGIPLRLVDPEQLREEIEYVNNEPLREQAQREQMTKRGRGEAARQYLAALRNAHGIDSIRLG